MDREGVYLRKKFYKLTIAFIYFMTNNNNDIGIYTTQSEPERLRVPLRDREGDFEYLDDLEFSSRDGERLATGEIDSPRRSSSRELALK